jgi:hypothetical protein
MSISPNQHTAHFLLAPQITPCLSPPPEQKNGLGINLNYDNNLFEFCQQDKSNYLLIAQRI